MLRLQRKLKRTILFLRAWRARLGREPELSLLPFFCSSKEVSIDIGAHKGIYTYFMHRYSSRVYAFEPLPVLSKNLTLAEVPNTRVIKAAASDHAGKAMIHIPEITGRLVPSRASLHSDLENAPSGKTIEIELVRIDDLISDSVAFIKIDAEGHELYALRGALQTIRTFRPTILLEQIDENAPSSVACANFLHAEGYEFVSIKGAFEHLRGHAPRKRSANVLWYHRDRLTFDRFS